MLKLRNNWKLAGILALILICLPFTEVSAATNLNLYLYNTKKNLAYTGKQVNFSFDGSALDTKNTPGVLIDGTSLASFLDVFVNSGIGLSYTYNSTKGVLTLSKNSTKLVLTEGSKTAVLNGKKVTMSVAPTRIKFKDVNKIKFMVPTEFVAKSFGYVYTWVSSSTTGAITSPLNISYSGKTVAYTSTKGAVTIDKKKVDVSDMPSIIINNTALLQAYKVFAVSTVKAGYNYDKATKVLTLTNDTTEMKLTMGSKTAYVNGRARTMDTAPLVVTNLDSKIAYVMVPGSFVASCLGYDYQWNSATKTSALTKSKIITLPGSEEGSGPELGGDPIPDTTTFSWGLAPANLDEYTKLGSITNTSEVSVDSSLSTYITGITKEDASTNSETYAIHGSLPFSKSTLTKQDSILNLHINNAATYYQTFVLGGFTTGNITMNTDMTNGSASNITFALTDPELKYELSLSSDGLTLFVKIYRNYLNLITAGISSGEEYLQITSMKDIKVNSTESGNIVTLQFPGTVNGIGENSIQTGLTSLKSVTASSIGNNALITFEKDPNSQYSVVQNGNTYRIVFYSTNTEYSLKFNIPDGLSYSDITTEDQYYKNRILIKLPGDWTTYYAQNPIQWSGNMINTVGLLVENGETNIVIDTALLQGYKLTDLGNGKVCVRLGDPRDIYKNIVVLDAGHGGTDPGAVRSLNGKTIYEKDLNYKIMYELTRKYFDSPDSEVKAYYSRYDDTLVNLYDRPAIADLVGADLFVSLHMNANTKADPKGTEIYYTNTNTSTTTSGLTSKLLATFVLDSLTDKIGTNKRYISNQNLVVTREANVPAILIELGFMSNKSDLTLLTDEDFQETAAMAIYDTICEAFAAYPTGR